MTTYSPLEVLSLHLRKSNIRFLARSYIESHDKQESCG